MRHHVPGTTFALAALRGNTEFELDFVKAHAGAGMTGNFTVRDAAADTDDHGWAWLVGWGLNRWLNYKCESVAFVIIKMPILL